MDEDVLLVRTQPLVDSIEVKTAIGFIERDAIPSGKRVSSS